MHFLIPRACAEDKELCCERRGGAAERGGKVDAHDSKKLDKHGGGHGLLGKLAEEEADGLEVPLAAAR